MMFTILEKPWCALNAHTEQLHEHGMIFTKVEMPQRSSNAHTEQQHGPQAKCLATDTDTAGEAASVRRGFTSDAQLLCSVAWAVREQLL